MKLYWIVFGSLFSLFALIIEGGGLPTSGSSTKYKRPGWLADPVRFRDGDMDTAAVALPSNNGTWIRVYLEETSYIRRVKIYHGKQDCCENYKYRKYHCCETGMVGASVYIKLGERYVTNCGKISSNEKLSEINCEGEGDSIELNQDGEVGMWIIREIEIHKYGDSFVSDPNPKFELVSHGRDVPSGSGLLLYNGGTVCSHKFSANNAQAICSEIMGYEVSHADIAWMSGEKWHEQNSYEVKMGNLKCSWHIWSYCSFHEYPECSHEDDIFLTCKFDYGAFDIVNKKGESGKSSGLLLYRGGTVCSDGFDIYTAIAICGTLGFTSRSHDPYVAQFTWSNESKWDIQNQYERKVGGANCKGSISLNKCELDVFDTGGCSQDGDVFLDCRESKEKLAAVYIVLIVGFVSGLLVYTLYYFRQEVTQKLSQCLSYCGFQADCMSVHEELTPSTPPVDIHQSSSDLNPSADNTNQTTENAHNVVREIPVPTLGTDNIPPPVYKETVPQQIDDTIPSYEEVMANQHIYQKPQ